MTCHLPKSTPATGCVGQNRMDISEKIIQPSSDNVDITWFIFRFSMDGFEYYRNNLDFMVDQGDQYQTAFFLDGQSLHE